MGFEALREVEEIGFLKDNAVAVPSGVFKLAASGGKKQPTLDTDHLNHEGVGKNGTTSDNISAYNPNSNNGNIS
jgi:hypothetical protein